ncbi:MAG: glycine cleavage system protein GcvH [Desulfobacula sp.]|jgi:glycine cleavage system H protein|uniref:glycine cleavage system protein GcvH n=1 Tax=Desulfobacula sp. TaxID=2593537 RepID=UPI001D62AE3B|nr:glycine cleavage system protein GcvH [Desulfobacula sp.]MBT3806744.1 glycine cleavage system protein GcvH [Desulfobacula sp.]MBT4200771.1 glycine cleavage system protein GcvH [Desulfobacula sp.]MBT4508811.1 glycine cleavage system protein GcvH [Desulfobacula sp.]MBT4875383.1 glycine cleavage system protein GcvH [Desulfobacula sp.]
MKEISDLNLPDDVKYTESHEWAKIFDGIVTIGLNDYAQDQLGEIVFVELPEKGDTFSKGDEFGSVESVKAVSEIYIPISGEIVEINEDLEDAPELVNESCYENGWLVKIQPDDVSQLDDLFDKTAYFDTLKG